MDKLGQKKRNFLPERGQWTGEIAGRTIARRKISGHHKGLAKPVEWKPQQ